MPITIGDSVEVFINQNNRDCQIVEELPKYMLGVYCMPNGRSFLCRIHPDLGDTRRRLTEPASKKERDHHAVRLACFQIDASDDLFDKAHDSRTRRAQWKWERTAKDVRRSGVKLLADAIIQGKEIPEGLHAAVSMALTREAAALRKSTTRASWDDRDLQSIETAISKLPAAPADPTVPPKSGPGPCPTCPHGLGLNCRTCWPIQYK